MDYAGFPRAALGFLADLEANNDRGWFEAQRAVYDKLWLGAGLDLIAALSAPCSQLRPPLLAVPKLNASLRRIHRDVRFSRDKRPYDARLHIILSTGPAFNRAPGVHLVIGPASFGFGAGAYGLGPDQLDRYRRFVSTSEGRQEFEALLAAAASVGADLDPPELARPPKGYDTAEWDGMIRRKSVIVRAPKDQAHPVWLFGPDAVEGLMTLVRALNPLTHWLQRIL